MSPQLSTARTRLRRMSTMLHARVRTGCLVVTLCAGCAAPLFAQDSEPSSPGTGGPFLPFATGSGTVNALGIRASGYGAYDHRNRAEDESDTVPVNPAFLVDGAYYGFDVRAGFEHRTRRDALALTGWVEGRYYERLKTSTTESYSGAADWTRRFRRTTAALGVMASKRSSFRLGSLEELRRMGTVDIAAPVLSTAGAFVGVSSTSYGATAGVSHRLSERTTVTATYSGTRATYEQASSALEAQTGSLDWRHDLTRGLYASANYRITDWRTTGRFSTHTSLQNVFAGLGYGRRLTDRTTIGASVGYATVPNHVLSATQTISLDAHLSQRISQAWSGNVRYGRGVSLLEGVADPLTSDRFEIDLNGRLSRVVSVSAFGAYATGLTIATGGYGGNSSYRIGTAGATVSARLGRYGEAFASYYLNRYRFPRGRLLQLGVSPNVARNTAMVGVTVHAGTVLR